MRKSSLLSLLILLTCASALRVPREPVAHAQFDPPAPTFQRYTDGELSFLYPSGWTEEDKGDAETLRVVVRPKGSSAFIEVASPRASVTTHEQLETQKSLWSSAAEEMRQRLGVKKLPSKDEYRCPPFGERPGSGVILNGRFEGHGAKGEVYGMIAGSRYVNVSFFRTDSDERAANDAWKTVLGTLEVEGKKDGGKKLVLGAVVDGKAVSKPQPDYPDNLKAAGVGGQVTVKVTINEKGDVIEAHAVSGEPQLRGSAEAAAMRAKYTPTTLCGHAVKVSGVINYNFKP